MRISIQQFPVKIIMDQKQQENVVSFKYLGSILTNDRRYTCEIKHRIAMAKAADCRIFQRVISLPGTYYLLLPVGPLNASNLMSLACPNWPYW